MMIRINRKQLFPYDKALFCLQFILFSNCINYCVKVFQTRLENSDSANALYIYLFIFLIFILGIVPRIYHRIKIDIFIFFYLLVNLYLISSIKNGVESLFFENTIIWTFGCGFISYITVRYIDDWKSMLNMYTSLSRVVLITMVICWFFTKNIVYYRSTPEWYMFFSSSLLVPFCGVLIMYEEKRKLLDLVCLLAGIALIIIYGARGSLLQIVVFFVLYYVMNGKYLTGIGKLLIAIVVLFIFLKNIGDYVDISSSRTLYLLFNNAIGETDRISAWKQMLIYFDSQPIMTKFFGLGLTGERLYIYENIYRAGYPHNIFIEQLLQLGIIGFAITMSLFFLLSVKTIICAYKKEYATIVSLFLTYFTVLLFSSSYLSSSYFFMWIAICMNVLEKRYGIRKCKVNNE